MGKKGHSALKNWNVSIDQRPGSNRSSSEQKEDEHEKGTSSNTDTR